MIFKYVNHLNKEVDLNKGPYRMLLSDLLDYKWSYTKNSNEITGFTRGISTKKVEIDVLGNSLKSSRALENDLTDIFEADITAMIPGRIYVDEYYLQCYIYSNKKTRWESGVVVNCEYGLVTDRPVWIKKINKEYRVGTSETASTGLDYPYDFPHDFSSARSGNATLVIDNVADNDYEMIIYGPCTDPVVYINGYPYQVYDNLSANEHIIVRSADHTVTKYLSNGTTKDLYNFRGKIQSIFKKIPSGKLSIIWSGTFGFDLTIFAERSEPKWN